MLSDAFPTAIYNVLIIPKMTLARTRCSIFLQQCNFFQHFASRFWVFKLTCDFWHHFF